MARSSSQRPKIFFDGKNTEKLVDFFLNVNIGGLFEKNILTLKQPFRRAAFLDGGFGNG